MCTSSSRLYSSPSYAAYNKQLGLDGPSNGYEPVTFCTQSCTVTATLSGYGELRHMSRSGG